MSAATEAADLLRVFFKNYEAAQAVSALLEQVGSIENSIGEKQKLVAEADSSLATLREQSEAVQRDIEQARSAAVGILKAAQAEAAETLEKAKSDAQEVQAQAAEEVTAAQAQLSAARDELASVQAQAVVAAATLADINGKIDAARDAARRLIGG